MRKYRADLEEWKQAHKCGKKSLAEAVFSMMKLRDGENLRLRGHRE